MNIDKIVQPVVDSSTKLISKATSSISGSVTKPIEGGSQKLLSALDGLAQNAKVGINPIKPKSELPEFLYHMTSLENYKKMLQDGKINFSAWEAGENGCHGIYMVDKKNFLQRWMGGKKPELFWDMDIDVGEMLLAMVNKDGKDIVALRIPTSQLDTSKLKFRPFFTMSEVALDTVDINTGAIGNELVKTGWNIAELQKYINAEPVEYVYQSEIPTSIISSITQSDASVTAQEIAERLFGAL